MAIKGVSKPTCADYTDKGNGKVSYSNKFAADHAVEYSVEVEASDNNDLYADNRVQENAGGMFTSGTVTLQTADLAPEIAKKMLGYKEVTRMVKEKQVKEIVADDDQKVPYMGFGIIEEHQIDGATKYLPIVFPKVMFNIPADAATTRGNTIEWQTKEISGKILRSDQVDENYKHPWRICPTEMFDTEADAQGYVDAVLNAEEA